MASHTRVVGRDICDSGAIVGDRERAHLLVGGQPNQDMAGMAVLDGVVYRLPCDVVKMRRHCVVVNQHRGKTLEAAGNPEQVLHFARPLL